MISYDKHEISVPDEFIKPYVDFINNNSLDARCDFELTDKHECDVYSHLYQFHYFLGHYDERVELELFIWPKNQGGLDSLEWLDQHVSKFNKNHSTKISYEKTALKKFFFRKTHAIKFYHLILSESISSDNKIIADTFKTFYSDTFDFFKIKPFDENMPNANYPEESGDSFLKYLQDNILLFEVHQKDFLK